jgi:preprotein translocase subunit SecE
VANGSAAEAAIAARIGPVLVRRIAAWKVDMSKEKTLTSNPPRSAAPSVGGAVMAELFHAGLYKPSQGKGVRQVTFAAAAIMVAIGCYELYGWLAVNYSQLQFPVPLAILLVGVWICYRLVNVPKFADFLIAVQAEMNKVSWPSQQELVRSSIVVIVVIVLLAVVLFGFDLFWMALFQTIGVLKK